VEEQRQVAGKSESCARIRPIPGCPVGEKKTLLGRGGANISPDVRSYAGPKPNGRAKRRCGYGTLGNASPRASGLPSRALSAGGPVDFSSAHRVRGAAEAMGHVERVIHDAIADGGKGRRDRRHRGEIGGTCDTLCVRLTVSFRRATHGGFLGMRSNATGDGPAGAAGWPVHEPYGNAHERSGVCVGGAKVAGIGGRGLRGRSLEGWARRRERSGRRARIKKVGAPPA